jgi:hypothetical protein
MATTWGIAGDIAARGVAMTAPKPKRAKALGVTDEQYAAMLGHQGGRCALCPSEPKTRRLHVDHDHDTGEVRGLLCHRCNRALAAWMRGRWLLRAARYVGATWADFRGESPAP